jgi:hypothetical protein
VTVRKNLQRNPKAKRRKKKETKKLNTKKKSGNKNEKKNETKTEDKTIEEIDATLIETKEIDMIIKNEITNQIVILKKNDKKVTIQNEVTIKSGTTNEKKSEKEIENLRTYRKEKTMKFHQNQR